MKDWIRQAGMTSRVRFACGASCLSLPLTYLAAANYSRCMKAMALLVSRCMPNIVGPSTLGGTLSVLNSVNMLWKMLSNCPDFCRTSSLKSK